MLLLEVHGPAREELRSASTLPSPPGDRQGSLPFPRSLLRAPAIPRECRETILPPARMADDDDDEDTCEVPGCGKYAPNRIEREGPRRCDDHYEAHLHEIDVLPRARRIRRAQ